MADKKENKIKYNLKGVHVAKQTAELQEDGSTKYSYVKPRAIPGAVSLSMDPEGEISIFYADGIAYYTTAVNNGYSGDLEMAYIPDWFREEYLNEEKTEDGVLIETAENDTNAFALLFEFDGDVMSVRHCMYNCTCARPNVGSETKEENVEPVTETMSLTCNPRADGLVKVRTGPDTTEDAYNKWYTRVYEKQAQGVSLWPGSQPALGKMPSDLVGDDVMILPDGNVVGTFHHVKDYIQFDKGTPENQKGWFLPFVLSDEYKEKEITVKRESNEGGTEKTVQDLEWILRLTDGADTIYSVKIDGNPFLTLQFKGATLEQEAGA